MVISIGMERVRFKKDFREEGSSELSIENGKCSTVGLQGEVSLFWVEETQWAKMQRSETKWNIQEKESKLSIMTNLKGGIGGREEGKL